MKVGNDTADEVTDSTTDATELVASVATSSMSSRTSARDRAAAQPSVRREETRMVAGVSESTDTASGDV